MPVTITTESKERAERVPSTVSFPYSDITDAIAVAEGLLKGGGLPLSRDQLGAAMGLVPNTGSFNTKMSTARIFGVMDNAGGKYQLTDLGDAITDAGRQREAMVEAFLNVELYKKVYDEFRGKRLPPRPGGLERAFIQFGVSPKQARNARLAFEKSARLAGFYPGGDEDRLVIPFAVPGVALQPVTGSDGKRAEAPVDQGRAAVPAPAPSPPPSPRKLEYELVDLLKADGIGDEESAAIWTLVRFLAGRKKMTPES